MINPKLLKQFHVKPGTEVNLKDYVTDWTETDEAKKLGKDDIKERAAEILEENRKQLDDAQELLYASDTHSVLLIFQAMDAAGKDGTIRHVMSGVNPQGCQVFSFKKPSAEELDHNFLWRYMKCLPERGRIGIFNRSLLRRRAGREGAPGVARPRSCPPKPDKKFWDDRYEDINNFEKHLSRNGTLILKFFLNVSKEEQKQRFLERLTNPEKHWKFSEADLAERAHWKEYRRPSRTRSPPPAPRGRRGMSSPPTANMSPAPWSRTSSPRPSRTSAWSIRRSPRRKWRRWKPHGRNWRRKRTVTDPNRCS